LIKLAIYCQELSPDSADPVDAEHPGFVKLEISQYAKREPLSLTPVAEVAGASVFPSVRSLRSTGLKFTGYVARVRLEDAKNQLESESPHQRNVYDVGFQSLTHLTECSTRLGQSRTEFRAHLHSGQRKGKTASPVRVRGLPFLVK